MERKWTDDRRHSKEVWLLDGTGHRKIGVAVAVKRMFAIGGPTSLTMKWTDDRRHSKEVWLLEMGPIVWNGAGGALFDMSLVLLMLLQSLAICQFARAKHTFLMVCLMATVWRLTIWNALSWIKLPKEIGTTVQQGFFTEGIMRIRSDAFGIVAPVLAVVSCCVAAMSEPDSIAGYCILCSNLNLRFILLEKRAHHLWVADETASAAFVLRGSGAPAEADLEEGEIYLLQHGEAVLGQHGRIQFQIGRNGRLLRDGFLTLSFKESPDLTREPWEPRGKAPEEEKVGHNCFLCGAEVRHEGRHMGIVL
ncbi:hypothetical protein AK812_SmicGene11263 [Symbiodinium microadriaticum]|uniref:Uncharacterized protein n=1 Tax=Symbiodinium microadriaticum TaxID=2951 RepID=A0A1Q9EDU8_SYMMI|nr:hypothetical protein AK812_SmicGene11263 [Symbiodinium microadriaticum]